MVQNLKHFFVYCSKYLLQIPISLCLTQWSHIHFFKLHFCLSLALINFSLSMQFTVSFLHPSLLQELLLSVGTLEFSGGKAEISDVFKCVGDVSHNIFVGQNFFFHS